MSKVHKWPFLRTRSENMAKNCPKCCQIAKFEPVNGISWPSRKIMVKDYGNVPGWRDLRMRRELRGL